MFTKFGHLKLGPGPHSPPPPKCLHLHVPVRAFFLRLAEQCAGIFQCQSCMQNTFKEMTKVIYTRERESNETSKVRYSFEKQLDCLVS